MTIIVVLNRNSVGVSVYGRDISCGPVIAAKKSSKSFGRRKPFCMDYDTPTVLWSSIVEERKECKNILTVEILSGGSQSASVRPDELRISPTVTRPYD